MCRESREEGAGFRGHCELSRLVFSFLMMLKFDALRDCGGVGCSRSGLAAIMIAHSY